MGIASCDCCNCVVSGCILPVQSLGCHLCHFSLEGGVGCIISLLNKSQNLYILLSYHMKTVLESYSCECLFMQCRKYTDTIIVHNGSGQPPNTHPPLYSEYQWSSHNICIWCHEIIHLEILLHIKHRTLYQSTFLYLMA